MGFVKPRIVRLQKTKPFKRVMGPVIGSAVLPHVYSAGTSISRAYVGLNVGSQYYGYFTLEHQDLWTGGDAWEYHDGTGNHVLPGSYLDSQFWPTSNGPGAADFVRRIVNIPRVVGQVYDVAWSGTDMVNGSLVFKIGGTPITPIGVNYAARTASLVWPVTQIDGPTPLAIEYSIGGASYPKNFTITPTGDANTFDAKFLADIQALTPPGGPLRIMKMTGVEDNFNNTSAFPGALLDHKTTLTSGEWLSNDGSLNGGVTNDGWPIEGLVAMANTTGRSLWDTVHWNVDDTYYTDRFTYVRDNLAAGLIYYCEVSNEIWNFSYKGTTQANAEAVSEGLVRADTLSGTGGPTERLVEKTIHVMDIAATVFSGQMNRLSRVFAMQNAAAGYWAVAYLDYAPPGMTALKNHIDMIASAPYFEQNWAGGSIASSYTGDPQAVFDAARHSVDEVIGYAAQIQASATARGVAYGIYEGGQSLFFDNAAYRDRIHSDSRMYTLYRYFLTEVERRLGRVPFANFLYSYPNLSNAGWGILQRSSQTISLQETPKAAAQAWYTQSGTYPSVITPEFSRGSLKNWNGTAWVTKPQKYWTGSVWATKPMKAWNGVEWITVAGGAPVNMVIDGTFDAGGGAWTTGSGAISFSAGAAHIPGVGPLLYQDIAATPGATYRATVQYNASGGINLRVTGGSSAADNNNFVEDTEAIIADSTDRTVVFDYTQFAGKTSFGLEADGAVFTGDILDIVVIPFP